MKKGILVILVLLGLVVALPLLSLVLLNNQWLQAKLIAIANEQLDAELAIGGCDKVSRGLHVLFFSTFKILYFLQNNAS